MTTFPGSQAPPRVGLCSNLDVAHMRIVLKNCGSISKRPPALYPSTTTALVSRGERQSQADPMRVVRSKKQCNS